MLPKSFKNGAKARFKRHNPYKLSFFAIKIKDRQWLEVGGWKLDVSPGRDRDLISNMFRSIAFR
ncbi:MAG: hypothetical protein D4R55_00430 [Chitinophagaceae bacterium]|nr:MAG: hypothetical protein D4R55_00430 [Chitinophagaceae bacterium]